MMTSKMTILTAAALLFAFTACGPPGTDEGTGGGSGGSSGTGGNAGGGTGGGSGGGGGAATVPTVTSTSPTNNAQGVALNAAVTATFSEEMTATTLTPSTFTVTSGTSSVPVAGTVIYATKKAGFRPTANLNSATVYTATISTAAKSSAGAALASAYTWSFTTGTTTVPGNPVNLGTAADFAILAKAAVSTVPTSAVTGNVGVSPAAATYITGFSLTADQSGTYATSPQVTGKVYAADYTSPTPSNMTTAVSDMELAYTDASGRAADFSELGAGNIGGMTLAAGVYKWGTGVLIPTSITLTGGANEVWIFEIAQDLTLASSTNVTLAGGALAKNIFWQVAGRVELGTTAHLEGTVLSKTSITLKTGSSVNGRLLAQTAVSIDGSTVVKPSP